MLVLGGTGSIGFSWDDAPDALAQALRKPLLTRERIVRAG